MDPHSSDMFAQFKKATLAFTIVCVPHCHISRSCTYLTPGQVNHSNLDLGSRTMTQKICQNLKTKEMEDTVTLHPMVCGSNIL